MKRLALCLAIILLPALARAEDLATIFTNVMNYTKSGNIPKALQELKWAQKELDKLNATKIQAFLPDSVAGFTGEKLAVSGALGINSIERNYAKGETKVKVSLTDMSSSGMGQGLAGFAQMAALMGAQQPGQDTFRIEGMTANLQEDTENKTAELTVTLTSGSMVKLEAQNGSGSDVRAMAEALKLSSLDNYMKGNG